MSVIKRTLLSWPKAAIGIAALVGVGAIVTIVAAVSSTPSPQQATATSDGAGCEDLSLRPGVLTERPKPCQLPGDGAAVTFADGQGQPLSLADFKGRVVLVNFWATWCPPCVREMPALDSLQAQLGGADFAVVAISQDRGGVTLPRAFLDREGLGNLDLYLDPDGTAGRALGLPGLPTSMLIDAQGREVARLLGAAEWDSPEMVERIKALGGL